MDRKPKLGLSVMLLLGVIYGCIGGLFLLIGICMTAFPTDSEARLVGSIFTLIGGIFLLLGIGFLVIEIHKHRQAQMLIAGNRYVWGEVIELAPNPSIRINGRNPYVARVRVLDSQGVTHIFKSRNLRTYPDPSIIGRKVKVYYQDDTYKTYYVDIDSILPLIIEH